MTPSAHDTFTDYLADKALGCPLSPECELEFESLVAAGHADDDVSLEMTAAVLEVSLLTRQDFVVMPAEARRRLEAAGAAWAAVTSGVLGGGLNSPSVFRRRAVRVAVRWGPWAAAAACLTMAVIAWSPSSRADTVKIVESDPNKLEASLASWTDGGASAPEAKESPMGCVCWSEANQSGFLRLKGVPVNDCEHQYQVWIIDDRGMDERISGGVFDCKSANCVVEIHPAIPVHHAKAFAITIEGPGGTMVSKMTHKLAIAKCGNH